MGGISHDKTNVQGADCLYSYRVRMAFDLLLKQCPLILLLPIQDLEPSELSYSLFPLFEDF